MKRKQDPPVAVGGPSNPEALPTEAQVRTTDLEAQQEELRGLPDETHDASRLSEREQAIRQAAYEAYVRRGGGPGSDLDDWLEAERNLDRRGD